MLSDNFPSVPTHENYYNQNWKAISSLILFVVDVTNGTVIVVTKGPSL